MSKWQNNSNNDIYEVYQSSTLSKMISNKLKEISQKNKDEYNYFEGFQESNTNCSTIDSSMNRFRKDISDNIIQLNTKIMMNNDIIHNNSSKIDNEVYNYSVTNNHLLKDRSNYELIDEDGNLLKHNIDINPTINDAMLLDTKDLLIQQNNMYIAGTFIITFILISIIVIQ